MNNWRMHSKEDQRNICGGKEILSEERMFRKAEFLQAVPSICLLKFLPSGGVDSTMKALHTI